MFPFYFSVIVLMIIRSLGKSGDSVILLGLCDSGKTSLFGQVIPILDINWKLFYFVRMQYWYNPTNLDIQDYNFSDFSWIQSGSLNSDELFSKNKKTGLFT